jgi:hypothetical protein
VQTLAPQVRCDLVGPTKVDTEKQLIDLDEYQAMVTETVVDDRSAHSTTVHAHGVLLGRFSSWMTS